MKTAHEVQLALHDLSHSKQQACLTCHLLPLLVAHRLSKCSPAPAGTSTASLGEGLLPKSGMQLRHQACNEARPRQPAAAPASVLQH